MDTCLEMYGAMLIIGEQWSELAMVFVLIVDLF